LTVQVNMKTCRAAEKELSSYCVFHGAH
jgi:hypothetical protein